MVTCCALGSFAIVSTSSIIPPLPRGNWMPKLANHGHMLQPFCSQSTPWPPGRVNGAKRKARARVRVPVTTVNRDGINVPEMCTLNAKACTELAEQTNRKMLEHIAGASSSQWIGDCGNGGIGWPASLSLKMCHGNDGMVTGVTNFIDPWKSTRGNDGRVTRWNGNEGHKIY
ncbi:hypothetical protein DFH09DRAFT_1102549 [Mycena vulgaris]|nr:hypothetical protein DFH09DRAFT_1102549 [Mycena vulgaris]